MIQNPDVDFLMKTQGQSSFLVYPFNERNSLSRLYHIRPDCFKPYNDFCNFTQYMFRFAAGFGMLIPSGTFIYISESSEPYKYAVTTSINCKDRRFWTANELNIGRLCHSSLENKSHYNQYRTFAWSLVLPTLLYISLPHYFLFSFRTKTHLYPIGKIPCGIVITFENTFILWSEAISVTINILFREISVDYGSLSAIGLSSLNFNL